MKRSETYLCDLGEPTGPEQGFYRPAVIISVDPFHRSGLAVILPITSTRRPVPTSIEVTGAGLDHTSYIQVDQIRTVSQKRLARQLGRVDEVTMLQTERALMRLLGLG
ncbi:type II toxin-antitoxin system PemK/MazF family toxin [Haloactinospora alba]|nr:type II toxin-antitoxin system PemK/MazF family toxin [Haloactinospora alba]